MITITNINTVEGQTKYLASLFKALRIKPEAIVRALKLVYGEIR